MVSVGGLNFFVEEDAATELEFGDFSSACGLEAGDPPDFLIHGTNLASGSRGEGCVEQSGSGTCIDLHLGGLPVQLSSDHDGIAFELEGNGLITAEFEKLADGQATAFLQED